MDWRKLLENRSITSKFFQDFLYSSKPDVEERLHEYIETNTLFKEKIYSVLDNHIWNEFLHNSLNFVENLSIILISLFFDKMLITMKKLEGSIELNKFINEIYSLEDEVSNEFVLSLEKLWETAHRQKPSTPILSFEHFPLNSILNLVLTDHFCKKTIFHLITIQNKDLSNYELSLPYFFEYIIPKKKRMMQGQFFTPLEIVEFLCRESISVEARRIIDPACGTGLFLLGALRFLVQTYSVPTKIDLIGIEKDSLLAIIAESAINYFLLVNNLSKVSYSLYQEDFFNISIENIKFSDTDSGKTVLLMNPPYTRQECISTEYKGFLNSKIGKISGRSGLYAYFLLHATNFLKEGDICGLIIPNSWLDVDYGKQLKKFFLNHFEMDLIISSRRRKLIPNVDVNTTILKLKRKDFSEESPSRSVENVVNFISIDRAESLNLLLNLKKKIAMNQSPKIRVRTIKQNELQIGSKWSLFFRAPPGYLQLMKKLRNKFVNLSDIAEVRRGFTSGANDFFYVGKPGRSNSIFRSAWDPKTGDLRLRLKNENTKKQFRDQGFNISDPMFSIEKEYWMHKTENKKRVSWEYSFKDKENRIWAPNYIVKSPRELKSYEIRENDLQHVVLIIHTKYEDLKKGILKYIHWGEEWVPLKGKKFNQRPTCKSRKSWFELPVKEYHSFNLLCLMTINDRFPFFFNPRDFYFDARLYGVRFKQAKLEMVTRMAGYFLFLNSFFTSLQIELVGRSNLGEGGLDVKVYEYELLKIPSYELVMLTPLIYTDIEISALLKISPPSVVKGEEESMVQITDNYISRLLSIPLDSIKQLSMDFRNLVTERIDKAK